MPNKNYPKLPYIERELTKEDVERVFRHRRKEYPSEPLCVSERLAKNGDELPF